SGRITGTGGAWERIAGRVAAIPAYAEHFRRIYPEIAGGRPIAFTDIANAIATFIAFEWRADNSAFDAMLRGEGTLDPEAMEGMRLFYGPAGCADCHAGKFQTDQSFHAMGEPQFGPGKAERFEQHSRDIGRARVTNSEADAYAFRTPTLRNVTATGPWGHTGAHSDLAAFLRYHAAPAAALAAYDRGQAVFPAFTPAKDDWAILDSSFEVQAIADAARA